MQDGLGVFAFYSHGFLMAATGCLMQKIAMKGGGHRERNGIHQACSPQ